MKDNTKTNETQPTADILASLVRNGDIGKLTAAQKVTYYRHVCDKLGLDPLSQPFRILKLHGKEILYCHRGGIQQLNKLHQVSHEIKAREVVSGCYVVTAQASTPDGRKTESIGAAAVHHLQGEPLCNAMMKAETKAKRRATLDLLGLGMMDETELPTEPARAEPDMQQPPKYRGIYTPYQDLLSPAFPDSLFLSDKGLEKAVNKCNDEEGLLVLYNDNKQRIDHHPELKQLFTERKLALRKHAA